MADKLTCSYPGYKNTALSTGGGGGMSLKGKGFGWINENDGAISKEGDECRMARHGGREKQEGIGGSKKVKKNEL